MTLRRSKDFMHDAEMRIGPCDLVPPVPTSAMGRTLCKGPQGVDVLPVREHEEGEVVRLGGQFCECGRST